MSILVAAVRDVMQYTIFILFALDFGVASVSLSMCAVTIKPFCSVPFFFFSHRGFPADSGECQPCAQPCLTCRDKDSHCLSCQQGYLMLHHACSATCPLGHYAKEGECHHCPPHCRDCNQDGMCASECRIGESWDFSKKFHLSGGKNKQKTG